MSGVRGRKAGGEASGARRKAPEPPPVGVKILRGTTGGFEGVEAYSGVSYCDAVRSASEGRELLLEPGCIEVCKWSPVVLGLKEPENGFEMGLEPRLEAKVAGVYLARLDMFLEGVEPDVVIVRGRPERIIELAGMIGDGAFQRRYRGEIYRTALGVGDGSVSWRAALSKATNHVLSWLKRSEWFDASTRRAFRSQRVTVALEKLIKRTMTSMSVCRNSTVIPLVEDAGNMSYFCTGGVTWGGNDPAYVTAGFPYRKIAPYLGPDA